jgi:hypothetical protein
MIWEKILGCRCQVIHRGGLPAATTFTALLDHPIPLKRSKMCAHRRMGQAKRLCQFINGAAGSAQQGDDSPTCTCKKLPVPIRLWHLLPPGSSSVPESPCAVNQSK